MAPNLLVAVGSSHGGVDDGGKFIPTVTADQAAPGVRLWHVALCKRPGTPGAPDGGGPWVAARVAHYAPPARSTSIRTWSSA